MLEVLSVQQDPNPWQIAMFVDGNLVNNPGVGAASSSWYSVANTLSSVAVAQGTHTLTVQVSPSYDLILQSWQVNYTLYEP